MVAVTNLITNVQPADPRSRFIEVRVSFNRDTGTTAYSAGDAIIEPGGNRHLVFPNCAARPGGSGRILRMQVVSGDVTGNVDLLIFRGGSAEGLTEAVDNASYVPDNSDRTLMVGACLLNATTLTGNAGSVQAANAARSELPMHFICQEGDANLYGILIARGGFTPTASSRFIVSLFIEREN